MKQVTLIFFFLQFFFHLSYSQVKGIIVDKTTGKPVPYANIWIENEDTGVSANEDGSFTISNKTSGKFLVITNVAYERKRIGITNDLSRIELTPIVYLLPEAVIKASKNKRIIDSKITDARKGFKSRVVTFNAIKPWIVARFYPYIKEYDETPYLTQIAFRAYSRGKASKYRIRLLGVDDKGEPGNDLIQEQLLLTSIAGLISRPVNLDIQKYNIKIPRNGFFIGFEFIQNYQKDGNGLQYLSVDAYTVEFDDGFNWKYSEGVWSNKIAPSSFTHTLGFPKLHFVLTLSD